MKTEIKKLGKSKVELNFELEGAELERYIGRALDRLRPRVKADGFRPGTVPKDLAAKKIGEETLLMEAGDLAVQESYERAVRDNQLEPVGRPEVRIMKLAKGNPLVFALTVEVLPEMTLPDYQKIAAKARLREISVDEKEIAEALEYLQKTRARFLKKDAGAAKKDFVEITYRSPLINGGKEIRDRFILGQEGFLPDFEEQLVGMKTGEEKTFQSVIPDRHPDKQVAGKQAEFSVNMIAVQTMELPEMNDEFAKQLGAFDNLVTLRKSIGEGIETEKQETEKRRRREEILSQIAKQVKVDLPEQMVAYEQERLLEGMKNQVAQNVAVDFDEYLKMTKKTELEMKDSLLDQAKKRITEFLILRQIGKQEQVEVSSQELEEEMNRHLRQYAPEQAEKIDIQQLREYAKDILFTEKVFEKLESFSNNKQE